MKNVIVKDGYELKQEMTSITVFEKTVPVYTTPQVLNNEVNRAWLEKLIEPFVLENKIEKRFLILEAQKSEVITYKHL